MTAIPDCATLPIPPKMPASTSSSTGPVGLSAVSPASSRGEAQVLCRLEVPSENINLGWVTARRLLLTLTYGWARRQGGWEAPRWPWPGQLEPPAAVGHQASVPAGEKRILGALPGALGLIGWNVHPQTAGFTGRAGPDQSASRLSGCRSSRDEPRLLLPGAREGELAESVPVLGVRSLPPICPEAECIGTMCTVSVDSGVAM